MTRIVPPSTVVLLLLAGCKPERESEPISPSESQAYSTVPTQESLQTAADEDAARREQEEADAAAAAAKEPPQPPPVPEGDKKFVDTAAKVGMAEVELSKIALEKSKKPAVKDFAQKMIDTHGKANEELKTLCAGRGIELPTELDEAAKRNKTELEGKSGTKLDKAYAAMMLEDHRKAVELFRTESQTGGDPQIKQWAGKMLPTLEEHLAHAEHMVSGKPYKPDVASTGATPPRKKTQQ